MRLSTQIFAYMIGLLLLGISQNALSFSFDDPDYWAVVGNTGNASDIQTVWGQSMEFGSVDYTYRIGKYEITTAQYVEFLNSVASYSDPRDLYNLNMSIEYNPDTLYDGISRITNEDRCTYMANEGWENKPVVYISWYDILRFVNWLHNGRPIGLQDTGTTEYGAYDMSFQSTNPENIVRLEGAKYWLPSEDEWYKAAYYDPDLYDGHGGYWSFPTGTNIPPDNKDPDNDTGNSANYYSAGFSVGDPYYSTAVGAYGNSISPYGTYDQAGNVWEWNESLIGINRSLRGGSWPNPLFNLSASNRNYYLPTAESYHIGARIAGKYEPCAIPEPLTLVLLSASLIFFVYHKR
ncbi:MAG: SUMF1/EgtB/PvdO family nonheme iron enzyme [Candidatus Auribacterota bacterium]|jgi:formylglycine-generating enzyme required for sulfatase activity|nr:SUMF1/EgtB/PvdO family nonheme iron enzyme [Candidatus Auribacterota bacterium]